MTFNIAIKDINELALTDATAIYMRLSWNDSNSDSSIQSELEKRYLKPTPGPHPSMKIALVAHNSFLVSWVGTRRWPEKFKGEPVMAQTVECFTDPECRRHGFARLGLQALICAGFVDRDDVVSVYSAPAVRLAKSCGCKKVILCEV